MAVSYGLGVTGDGAGVVTPLDHKLAQSGLIVKTGEGDNLIRPGVFYDGVSAIVSGTAGMSYDVAPFTAALSRGASAGTVLLSNDGVVNVATSAAPGTNSRIDIVYVWQREFSLDGTNSVPVIAVAEGTAAASPVAPSLAAFPGALELARITVPAGVTATNSGTTMTATVPFTATAGGVLVFRNSTERDAATVPIGTQGYLLSTGERAVFTADGWGKFGFGLVQSVYFTSSGTFSKASYPWLRAVRVTCVGGGGGGGGSGSTNSRRGGGGGGGGYAESFITDIAGLASSVTVTVGAGGSAGGATDDNAGTGGASSFGATVAAGGGSGGSIGSGSVSGGAGGVGTAGDLLVTGSAGIAGAAISGVASGAGGASGYGLGGGGRGQTSESSGNAGGLYGGGGSGGVRNAASSNAGGAGGAGIVIVELFA